MTYTKYQQEVKEIQRNKIITFVFEFLSIVFLSIFVITILIYSFDSGMAKDETYRSEKACIFESNCK